MVMEPVVSLITNVGSPLTEYACVSLLLFRKLVLPAFIPLPSNAIITNPITIHSHALRRRLGDCCIFSPRSALIGGGLYDCCSRGSVFTYCCWEDCHCWPSNC